MGFAIGVDGHESRGLEWAYTPPGTLVSQRGWLDGDTGRGWASISRKHQKGQRKAHVTNVMAGFSFFFPFKCRFLFNVLIGVWLLYIVLLVSAVQWSESAIVVVFSCSVVSSFLQTHGAQPARLLCPGDFPGKNTGVGCHLLLPFRPRDHGHLILCLLLGRRILYHWASREAWISHMHMHI